MSCFHKLKKFKQQLCNLYQIADNPEQVDCLEREDDIKSFVITFRELARLVQMLKTFDEFKFDRVGIAEQTFNDFRSKYLNLYNAVRKKNLMLKRFLY